MIISVRSMVSKQDAETAAAKRLAWGRARAGAATEAQSEAAPGRNKRRGEISRGEVADALEALEISREELGVNSLEQFIEAHTGPRSGDGSMTAHEIATRRALAEQFFRRQQELEESMKYLWVLLADALGYVATSCATAVWWAAGAKGTVKANWDAWTTIRDARLWINARPERESHYRAAMLRLRLIRERRLSEERRLGEDQQQPAPKAEGKQFKPRPRLSGVDEAAELANEIPPMYRGEKLSPMNRAVADRLGLLLQSLAADPRVLSLEIVKRAAGMVTSRGERRTYVYYELHAQVSIPAKARARAADGQAPRSVRIMQEHESVAVGLVNLAKAIEDERAGWRAEEDVGT